MLMVLIAKVLAILFLIVSPFLLRSIFLKLALFALSYPIILMCLISFGFEPGGILTFLGSKYYDHMIDYGFWLAFVSYFISYVIVYRMAREKVEILLVHISEVSRIILSFLFFLVAVIAYPKAFGLGEERWNLLPGQWSVVYLGLNAILLLSTKSFLKLSTFLYMFVLFAVIIGGERVDSIMSLVYFVVMTPDNEKFQEKKFTWGILAGLFFLFAVGTYVGMHRLGNRVNLYVIAYNVIAQHTVIDVIHVYLSSISYYFTKGINMSPLLNEISSMLIFFPGGGAGAETNYTVILGKEIPNVGGGLFYTEGMLMFGPIGVLLYFIGFAFLLVYFVNSKKSFYRVVFVIFFILQLRIQWYGLVYFYTPVFFTIFLHQFLLKYKKQKHGLIEEA